MCFLVTVVNSRYFSLFPDCTKVHSNGPIHNYSIRGEYTHLLEGERVSRPIQINFMRFLRPRAQVLFGCTPVLDLHYSRALHLLPSRGVAYSYPLCPLRVKARVSESYRKYNRKTSVLNI